MVDVTPRVAVLMATHNDYETLVAAIESVSSQGNTHVFLVDDFSNVAEFCERLKRSDVFVIRTSTNIGLTRALNTGLRVILPLQYEFVARMDADDVSCPDRIEAQIRYLDDHKDISGVGGWANYVDAGDNRCLFVNRTPGEPDAVARALMSNNCVLHPTWVLRAAVFAELDGYDERYEVAQDYEFLMRAVSRGHKFANLQRVLIDYRVSPGGLSARRRHKQLFARLRIQLTHLRPTCLFSWAGLAKTLALFFIPRPILSRVKQSSAV